MNRIETEDAQNHLRRIQDAIYLNVESPSISIKRQYQKAVTAISNARHELDILNDLKSKSRGADQ